MSPFSTAIEKDKASISGYAEGRATQHALWADSVSRLLYRGAVSRENYPVPQDGSDRLQGPCGREFPIHRTPYDPNHRAKSRAVVAAGCQRADQHTTGIEASIRNVRRLHLRTTPRGQRSLRGVSRNVGPDLLNLRWGVGAKAAQVSSWGRIRRWIFSLQHGAKATARSAWVRNLPILNRPVGGDPCGLLRADRVPSQGMSIGVISTR